MISIVKNLSSQMIRHQRQFLLRCNRFATDAKAIEELTKKSAVVVFMKVCYDRTFAKELVTQPTCHLSGHPRSTKMRLQQCCRSDTTNAWSQVRFSRCARRWRAAPGNKRFQQLANDPTSFHQRRVRRRLWHPSSNAPKWRAHRCSSEERWNKKRTHWCSCTKRWERKEVKAFCVWSFIKLFR